MQDSGNPDVAMLPRFRSDFRFGIRPCEESLAPAIHEAAMESIANIRPWMAWLHPAYSLSDAAAWCIHSMKEWREGNSFEFMLMDREDGRVAGACGLNQIDRKDRFCNLGYWVRTSKTRLGAATQAVHLLKEFGFGELKLNRIEIVVAEGNRASRAVAEKAGAIYEGLQRSRVCVGEKVHDAHMYALIRPGVPSH